MVRFSRGILITSPLRQVGGMMHIDLENVVRGIRYMKLGVPSRLTRVRLAVASPGPVCERLRCAKGAAFSK